jgi:NADH:flavin oxidoreductase / NADH oxidase family
MCYPSFLARLFDPTGIRGLELANRIVMAPMTTRLAAPDGGVTDELVAYYEARAMWRRADPRRALVAPPIGSPSQVRARDPQRRFVGGLTRLVEAPE